MFKPLLLIIAGLAYAGFSAKHLLDDRALEQRGKTAVVQPLPEYTQTTTKKFNTPDRVQHSANITFETEAGETITVTKSLSADLISQLASARPVSIRYLPDNPRVTRLGNEGKSDGSNIGIGVLMLIIGGFWFRRVL